VTYCVFCWSDDCTDPGCQERATVAALRKDAANSGANPALYSTPRYEP
jgi:hypothetical protein